MTEQLTIDPMAQYSRLSTRLINRRWIQEHMPDSDGWYWEWHEVGERACPNCGTVETINLAYHGSGDGYQCERCAAKFQIFS